MTSQTATAATYMASKFNGRCLLCPNSIAAGEPIAYVRNAGASHADCYALREAVATYKTIAENGLGLAESILVAKSLSNVSDYELTEEWYIARMLRYCVPTLASEDAAWDAEDAAKVNADAADALMVEYATQQVKTFVTTTSEPTAPVTLNLSQGTYTIVFDSESITIRISKPEDGKQFVGALTGPNNESDYTCIAIVKDGAVTLTRAARAMDAKTLTRRALAWLCAATDEQRRAAGQAYAVASSRCYRCGRTLTVVSSIDAGLGPICAGKEYAD